MYRALALATPEHVQTCSTLPHCIGPQPCSNFDLTVQGPGPTPSPDTFRVCCGILSSNESKECECIMEFPLKFFRPQKGLSGYCILQWQINIFMQHILIMKIVKNLSLVLLHYTFTMYRPRVYNISQW